MAFMFLTNMASAFFKVLKGTKLYTTKKIKSLF